jgi:glycosyl transferase family 1
MQQIGNDELEQRNLALIQSIYPHYVDLLNSTQAAAKYQIEKLSDNSYSCCLIDENQQSQWLHGPQDPWQWAEAQVKQSNWASQRTFAILRPGLGYIPITLYPNLRKGRTAQRMLLVEDRIDLFRLSLRLFDWTDIIRSDRTILALTDKPVDTMVQFFSSNPVAILPPLSVLGGVIWGDEERRYMGLLKEQLGTMAQTVNHAARQYLNELKNHYISIANDAGHRKRVLMVEPEHDYLANPIAKAFEEEGCAIEMYKGNRRLLHFINPYVWLVYARENLPDVLLWMNRNTLSPEGAEDLGQLPIKKVLWYLDSPKRVKTSKEELDATDAYFSFDHSYLPYLKDLCGKAGSPLSTATGIKPLPECEPERTWPQRQGPDVGFMGALGADRFQDVLAFWQRRDPQFVQILDSIIEDFLSDSSISLEDRYNNSDGTTRLPFSGFVVLYLEERSTYLRRLRFLQPLKDLGLATYGAAEWGNPAWAEQLVSCYSGEKPSYETDLPRIYYHTKVNINVFHVQCVDSTNPRVYDVLAAGGFLLTEYRPEIEREFKIGQHLDCFHTPDEAREKAQYYLDNQQKREEIARAGQEFVLNNATYRHRVRELLDSI